MKSKFNDNPKIIAEIDDILSGKAKSDIDDFRDGHHDASEGGIPIILLPNN